MPPGMGGDWKHCAGLDLRYFESYGEGGLMPRMAFQLFNRQESLKNGAGLLKQSRREPYVQWRLMKFTQNKFWTPRSTGKNPNLKDWIRG